MKRKALESSVTTAKRGAKEGEIRNPEGRGGFKPGKSGNPDGRPVGAVNKVQLDTIWSAWKQSRGLPILFCFLNFRMPESMAPYGKRELLTRADDAELRAYLFKGYWKALDFVRKVCSASLIEEMGMEDMPMGLSQMAAERKARDEKKLVDMDEHIRRQAQA